MDVLVLVEIMLSKRLQISNKYVQFKCKAMGYLENYVREKLELHPELKKQITGFYNLYLTEIEDDCECPDHEASLCINDIDELIEEHLNP